LLSYVCSETRGFGLHIKGKFSDLKFETVANKITVMYLLGKVQVATTVSVLNDQRIVQSTMLKSSSTEIEQVHYTFDLNISLNRASYGQLTEGGPIPIPPPRNEFQLFNRNQTWGIVNRNLDAMVRGDLYCDDSRVILEPVKIHNTTPEQPVRMEFDGILDIKAGQTRILTSTYLLQPGCGLAKMPSMQMNPKPSPEEGWKIQNESMKIIIKGNLSYILGNCSIPVSSSATCLITDHVALPLGWNRDN
jgi:uncharacterized protein